MKVILPALLLVFLLLALVPTSRSAPEAPLFRGAGQNDFYVFVLGCVNIPGSPPPCQNDPRWDWKDWLARLRDYLGFGEHGQVHFDEWSQTHVRFLPAPTVSADDLVNAINALSPYNGRIFLIGFSTGGAAVLNYLYLLSRSPSLSIPPIGGAISVDSPLSDARELFSWGSGEYIGWVQVRDRFNGMGQWAESHGIALVTISYQNDYFNSKYPVGDIPLKTFATNPVYGGPFDLEVNHGYFFRDPNGLDDMFRYLFGNSPTHGSN